MSPRRLADGRRRHGALTKTVNALMSGLGGPVIHRACWAPAAVARATLCLQRRLAGSRGYRWQVQDGAIRKVGASQSEYARDIVDYFRAKAYNDALLADLAGLAFGHGRIWLGPSHSRGWRCGSPKSLRTGHSPPNRATGCEILARFGPRFCPPRRRRLGYRGGLDAARLEHLPRRARGGRGPRSVRTPLER